MFSSVMFCKDCVQLYKMVSYGDKFRYIHSDPKNQLAEVIFNGIRRCCYTGDTVSSGSKV